MKDQDKYFIQDSSGNWHFFDETWTDTLGPFSSKEKAQMALLDYIHDLNQKKKTK